MQSLHRVEKSHSTMVQEALGWEISRLRVSSKRFPSAPYRHASPLEMTMLASAIGHTCGVRVQKVQKVHRVQRVVVAAPPQIIKKGARLAPQVVSKGCVAFAQGATALRAEGDGGALRARILKKRGAPSVISTKAGQPPIGKPLIVQARGQLRLTWRLYAESPQSGEISLHHGTGSIGLGDLSTQSFIEAVPL